MQQLNVYGIWILINCARLLTLLLQFQSLYCIEKFEILAEFHVINCNNYKVKLI